MGTPQTLRLPADGLHRIVTKTVNSEGGRLLKFIRRRVADTGDAEDILQEVFYELTLAYRLPEPMEHLIAWMYRVALNRITDLCRKKSPALFGDMLRDSEEEEEAAGIAPSADEGPERIYARALLLEEISAAVDDLPPEQRDVFIAHELEGRSFKELSALYGVSVNTLISRKRYAVLRLRERLRPAYDDFINE